MTEASRHGTTSHCLLLHQPVCAPSGHWGLALEVKCPNHARPVPLSACTSCRAFNKVSSEGGSVWVLCRAGRGNVRGEPASTLDPASRYAHACTALRAELPVGAAQDAVGDQAPREFFVVDAAGRVVGVVGHADVAELRARCTLPDGERITGLPERVPLGQLARPLLVWAAPQTPMRRASETLAKTGQFRLALVQDGRLAGVLSRVDASAWFVSLCLAAPLEVSS